MSFTFPVEGSNTNAVLASGGTAAVPALRLKNSTNTGMYTANANTDVSFAVAGVKKFEILNGRTVVSNDLACNSYRESLGQLGNSGTTKTLAVTGIQRCTLTGNCTFSMPSGTTASHGGRGITLFLNSGAGNFTATFTGVKWPGNTAPAATTAPNKVDIFCFVNDGVNWYGSSVLNYTP